MKDQPPRDELFDIFKPCRSVAPPPHLSANIISALHQRQTAFLRQQKAGRQLTRLAHQAVARLHKILP